MPAGAQRTRYKSETIRDIIARHQSGQPVRAIALAIGSISFATVAKIIRDWKNDPRSIDLLCGDNLATDDYSKKVKQLLLEDTSFLHSEVRGWDIHPDMVRGWELQDKHREVLLCAFRGFGKSVAWGETRVIQQILRSVEAVSRRSRGEEYPSHWIPNYSCAYISAIDDQAKPHVANIRNFLLRQDIKNLFGDFRGAPWGDTDFVIRQRDQDIADPTVLGGGVFSSVWTGKHPDEIIFDDVVVINNVDSLCKLRKLQQQLTLAIEPIMRPTCRRSWINTPYADGDPISLRIAAAEDRGSDKYKIPAVILRALMPTDVAGHYRSTWPERFPVHPVVRDNLLLEGLLEKKSIMDRELPGSFAAQYQMDTSELQQHDLDTSKIKLIHISNVKPFIVSQFFDAAWSRRPSFRTDYSAMATGGFGADGNFYLLRCVRSRKSPLATREFIKQEYRLGPDSKWWGFPLKVWVEKTGLYGAEVSGLMQELSDVPWGQCLPRGSKEARSVSLQLMLETGRFYLVEGTGDWIGESRKGERDGIISEMDTFPNGTFDDRVDAICQLISACQQKYGLVGTEPERKEKSRSCGYGNFRLRR